MFHRQVSRFGMLQAVASTGQCCNWSSGEQSTRPYDLMRCEATMAVKDEVAHKHFCGGRDQQRMDGYQCLDATIVASSFCGPFYAFHPNTYSQGGLILAAKYNY